MIFNLLNNLRTSMNIHTGEAVHILILNLNFINFFYLVLLVQMFWRGNDTEMRQRDWKFIGFTLRFRLLLRSQLSFESRLPIVLTFVGVANNLLAQISPCRMQMVKFTPYLDGEITEYLKQKTMNFQFFPCNFFVSNFFFFLLMLV